MLKGLAERLTQAFGRCFANSNLQYRRRFYLAYQDRREITQFETGQLSYTPPRPFTLIWTHYVFLLGITRADERSFYRIEAIQRDWNLRHLRRLFDSGLY